MTDIEEGLTLLQRMVDEWAGEQDESELERLEEKLNGMDFSGVNQEQFVRFLELARDNSWDIPSALFSICQDEFSTYLDRFDSMHRPSYAIREGKLVDTMEDWDKVDVHFKEVHGLDLQDERINWSFDT